MIGWVLGIGCGLLAAFLIGGLTTMLLLARALERTLDKPLRDGWWYWR